ncbi:30725_t:CDS:1, partial [Gigaspora margarita]
KLIHKSRKYKARSNHFDSSHYDDKKWHKNNSDAELTNKPIGVSNKNTRHSGGGNIDSDIGGVVDDEQSHNINNKSNIIQQTLNVTSDFISYH